MEGLRETAWANLESQRQKVAQVVCGLHAYPELGGQEYRAAELLTGMLRENFEVAAVTGIATAFVARRGGGPGTAVALILEYDALPDIGHGCGHNLIAAAGLGAALALVPLVDEVGGTLLVAGTPAEESIGAKVAMVQAGIFSGVDAALMVHPGNTTAVEVGSLALLPLRLTFHGKAAHAATPGAGIDALEVLLDFFQDLRGWRRTLSPRERVEAIITQGGLTPNLVPEKTVAHLYLRGVNQQEAQNLQRRVSRLAREAAWRAGASVQEEVYEVPYKEMVSSAALGRAFARHLDYLGVARQPGPLMTGGSLDMGDVSQTVPSLHPYLCLEPFAPLHSREFARAAGSPAGVDWALLAAKCLVATALDVFSGPALAAAARQELEDWRRRQTLAGINPEAFR